MLEWRLIAAIFLFHADIITWWPLLSALFNLRSPSQSPFIAQNGSIQCGCRPSAVAAALSLNYNTIGCCCCFCCAGRKPSATRKQEDITDKHTDQDRKADTVGTKTAVPAVAARGGSSLPAAQTKKQKIAPVARGSGGNGAGRKGRNNAQQ